MIGARHAEAPTDYEKLLASDVDAVMISMPAFLHAEHFEKAVQAGKHIYIEKPAAPDVAGCKRIMRFPQEHCHEHFASILRNLLDDPQCFKSSDIPRQSCSSQICAGQLP